VKTSKDDMEDEIAELRKQVAAWRELCHTLTHQVICCGVAASHPDAALTTHGAYAGKWNSAQAEDVRRLRAKADGLQDEVGRLNALAGPSGKGLGELERINDDLLAELDAAYLEMRKIRPAVKAIFDRDVWDRVAKLDGA